MYSYPRLQKIPKYSFFLFGPRGVGKSSWLHQHFKEAVFFNLLKSDTYLEFSRNPGLLEAKIGDLPPQSWVCIDEVQRVPDLLNEVHHLIESKQYRFALSGSSARKLKKGGANLLGGRAITYEMESFVSAELKQDFDLESALQWGLMPLVLLRPEILKQTLSTYVHTYLKEEIRAEGLVRKVEPFVRFLAIAAQLNGQEINATNLAREAQVPRSTVETYLSILEDTLITHLLPAYRPQAKVREQATPKLYWFDAGIARAAAGLLHDPTESLWLGRSLETLLYHELRVYNHTHDKHRPIYYYKASGKEEIDFVIETKNRSTSSPPEIVCIEVKHAKTWQRKWEKLMRSLANSPKLSVKRMIGVYRGQERYHFQGLDVLPVKDFLTELYLGKIF